MTNATPAAGTPAADPYLRWRNRGRLVRPARPAHARARAPRALARSGTDATAQLLRCFPRWTRALEQLTVADTRAARRQRAGRPQRPGRVAQPRRARPGGPSPPRHGQGQRHAPDLGGDHGADRRAGAGRPRRRPRLEHRHHRRRARSTSGWRAPTPAADRRSRIRRVWAYQLDQRRALARPLGLDDASGGRPVAVGARQPQPVRRRRPALLADRLGHLARRSPASSSGRSARSSGRSACSSCRRSGRATGGS